MEKHLTEEEIALYVDAIEAWKQDQLPAEILAHVEECLECKIEVVELLKLIEAQEPNIKPESHPYLGGL